jgi:hypothetical protein
MKESRNLRQNLKSLSNELWKERVGGEVKKICDRRRRYLESQGILCHDDPDPRIITSRVMRRLGWRGRRGKG